MRKTNPKELIEILQNLDDDVDIVVEYEDMEKGTILKPISSVKIEHVVEREETFLDAFDHEEYNCTVIRQSYGQKTNKKVLLIR